MKVVWVFENINYNPLGYSKLDILLLLSSVRLWKRNNPSDCCILYCDLLTNEFIISLDVSSFWDDIIIFEPNNKINKNIFWASSKLEILHKQSEPVLILDHDTLVYKNINFILDKSYLWVMYFEKGNGIYPNNTDINIRNLSYKSKWGQDSVNTSLLYIPDVNFAKTYSKQSLILMEEFTKMGVNDTKYLIFAEQLLLKNMICEYKIEHKSIIKNFWICNDTVWSDIHMHGVWDVDEVGIFIKHYGPYKKRLKEKNLEKEYNFELKSLFFSINFRNFHLTQFLDSNEYPK